MRQIDFSAPKIVAPQRSKKNTFGYNEVPWFASMDVYFITALPNSNIELKYVLALLNSKLLFVWLYNKGKRKGDTLELYQKPLSEVPIIFDEKVQDKIVGLADKLLKNQDDYSTKEMINQEVYALYNLNLDEVNIVEEYMKNFE